jgi:hypothetical protein
MTTMTMRDGMEIPIWKKGKRSGVGQVLGDMLFLHIGVAGTGSMAIDPERIKLEPDPLTPTLSRRA